MNRINQFTVFFSCQFILGLLVVTSPSQVQRFLSPSAIAQTVVETLPAPPQLNKSNSQAAEEVFVPRDLDFRVPETATAQNSFLVCINNSNATQLEQIKQMVPTAYIRQYQGKSVIQAGVFSQELNAVVLAQKLQSQGISPHIFNITTAKELALKTEKSKFYFVVIPAKDRDLTSIERQVKQLPIVVAAIFSQRHDRGSYLRVGPFTAKEQAESYNHSLLASGLNNTQVYYGR
jgi:hypothetical protein